MTDILLDTSFLLPSMGVDTGELVGEALRRLGSAKIQIWISRFAVMESCWVAARLDKAAKLDSEAFSLGLRSVLKGEIYHMVQEGPEVFSDGLGVYLMGHRDLIDCLLYCSSVHLGLRFLTVDSKLRDFLRSKNLQDTTVLPSELEGLDGRG